MYQRLAIEAEVEALLRLGPERCLETQTSVSEVLYGGKPAFLIWTHDMTDIIQAKELAEHPLRIGLSMKATVDVSNQQGASVATATVKDKTLSTAAAADRFTEVDAAINDILSSYEH